MELGGGVVQPVVVGVLLCTVSVIICSAPVGRKQMIYCTSSSPLAPRLFTRQGVYNTVTAASPLLYHCYYHYHHPAAAFRGERRNLSNVICHALDKNIFLRKVLFSS